MTDYSKYSSDEFQLNFRKVYDRLTMSTVPSKKQPKAYILGGQSGAGKSTIHRILKEKEPDLIVIDGDRFREMHPNFEIIGQLYGQNAANYTQPFINEMVNSLIECLSTKKYGLIIEGTCRNINVPLNTCNNLKAKGYHVELAFMCTDKTVSWNSTINRYNEMKAMGLSPRAVPPDKYNETVKALPQNISKLYEMKVFDDICLYERSGSCIYRYSEQPNINPAQIVNCILNGQEQVQKPKTFSEGLAELVQRTKQENSRNSQKQTMPIHQQHNR